MDDKLIKKLREVAPSVYPKDLDFECRSGWYDILLKVGLALQKMNVEGGWTEPLIAGQIKEKFGTLRWYANPTNGNMEAAQKIIREAEHQSTKTCEYCGKPGKLRKKGWFKTLCATCAVEDEKITPEEAAKERLGL